MKITLTITLALLCCQCVEGRADTSLLFGGWSYHADKDFDYNEDHRIAGVKHNDIIAVGFTNSYNQASLAIGKEQTLFTSRAGSLDALYGFVSGYNRIPTPIVLPSVKLRVPGLNGVSMAISTIGVASFMYVEVQI